MYLMDTLEIEIVVSWVHSLSFWLTILFKSDTFVFHFFFLALGKGPLETHLFIPSSFEAFFFHYLFPVLCGLISFFIVIYICLSLSGYIIFTSLAFFLIPRIIFFQIL